MAKIKANDQFQNFLLTQRTFDYYFMRLSNIAISVFEWKNLPDSIDQRWLELSLYKNGMCLFFEDDVLGYLALPCTISGMLNVYNIPTMRRAYAANGFQAMRGEEDSVIIFHNYLHGVPVWDIEMFARRLSNYQRTIDININAQKTPIIILADDDQKPTWENIMMQYEGDTPLMLANNGLNLDALKTFPINAPFVADGIQEMLVQTWNDAMSYLGVSNVNVTKKERLITDEVQRNMGGVLASRYSPLEMRREAADQINRMFGLDIKVDYREDILAYQSQIIGETEEMIKRGELDDVGE